MNEEKSFQEEQKLSLDRRSFLKGAAVAGAAAATSALVGCQTSGGSASNQSASAESSAGSGSSSSRVTGDINMDNVNPIAPVSPPSSYDKETDVLIIGFGCGGTAAALQCANAGVDFIAIDVSPRDTWDEHAGVQVLAGTGGSRWAAAKNTTWGEADVDKLTEQIMKSNDYMAVRDCIRQHVTNFDDLLASLEALGCRFEAVDLSESFDVSGEEYSSCTFTCVQNDVAKYTASDPWINKYHGVENAIERFINANDAGELMFDTKATTLIQDSDGAILGAMVISEGKEMSIGAKKTIIATGGYGANLDMCKYDGYSTEFCGCYVGSSTNQGDGIRMGMGVGATLTCFGAVGVADGGPDALKVGEPWLFRDYSFFEKDGHSVSGYARAVIQLSRQPTLKVNAEGKRFMDENGTWQAKTQGAYAQPSKRFYTIFGGNLDEQIDFIKGSRYGMCENMITPEFRIFFTDDDIQPLWDWHDTIEEDARFKCITEADTLEELAEKIGINKENFIASVERYNELCTLGTDEDFGKHSSFLFPIDTPPYMAIESKPAFLWTTQGGLTINDKWQVLNEAGSDPIPNLYCGSDDCGGLIKPFNQGMETPFQQAAAAVLNGYIAGKNVVEELKS